MNFQRLIYLGNPWPNLLAQNSLPETWGGFMHVPQKETPQKASFYVFSARKLVQIIILNEVKPSPYSKMIKLLTFNNLFLPLQHSR